MILNDVFNDALQECEKASKLINDTNILFNNHVESNGIAFSSEIHTCIINGAFLTLFMTLERFLENSFICYMMGQRGINGNIVKRYIFPDDEEKAINILKGTSRFADFTNRDTIIKLANNFFEFGGTYSYLNSISVDFEEMKKIRNAISHISIESERAFRGLVRTKLGSLPRNINTSSFLNTIMPNHTNTFFIHYRDVVVNTINNIAMSF